MIEEYVPMDRLHDDFYRSFVEQRMQKIDDTEQPGIENTLPFPFEPLRTTLTTFPRNQISSTGIDSGVNSPLVLSPAMPVTPDSSHTPPPYLMPSTTRLKTPSNLSSGSLTQIQQIAHYRGKSKNKEPKDNPSQPEYYDLQSVLLTHSTRL